MLTNTFHIMNAISDKVFDFDIWPASVTEVDENAIITKFTVTMKETWQVLQDEIFRSPEWFDLLERQKVLIFGSHSKKAVQWSQWAKEKKYRYVEHPSLWRLHYKKEGLAHLPYRLFNELFDMDHKEFWALVRDGRINRRRTRRIMKEAGMPVPPMPKRRRTVEEFHPVDQHNDDDVRWSIVDIKLISYEGHPVSGVDDLSERQWNALMNSIVDRMYAHEEYECVVPDRILTEKGPFLRMFTDIGDGISLLINMFNEEASWPVPCVLELVEVAQETVASPPLDKRRPGLRTSPPVYSISVE